LIAYLDIQYEEAMDGWMMWKNIKKSKLSVRLSTI
jgi:hypothetical protein